MNSDTPSLLDPWEHAQLIAQRLGQPNAQLIVVIGAEQWCTKCAELRPKFEALATQAAQSSQAKQRVTLWLDLEDHAEFLGSFIPPDLPLMLRWQAGQCVHAVIISAIEPNQQPAMTLQEAEIPTDLPDLWRELTQANWGL
jgi:thiol-disulfide isomerase/thioredoxin